jgi:hypothetical protein
MTRVLFFFPLLYRPKDRYGIGVLENAGVTCYAPVLWRQGFSTQTENSPSTSPLTANGLLISMAIIQKRLQNLQTRRAPFSDSVAPLNHIPLRTSALRTSPHWSAAPRPERAPPAMPSQVSSTCKQAFKTHESPYSRQADLERPFLRSRDVDSDLFGTQSSSRIAVRFRNCVNPPSSLLEGSETSMPQGSLPPTLVAQGSWKKSV